MKDGFVTALGTPIESDGTLAEESYRRHIDDQVDAGASALLAMGTMGNEAYLRDTVYPTVAKAAADAVGGRVPLLIGVTDLSIARVLDRVEAISDIDCDGIVATAPYYLKTTQEEILSFFSRIAEASTKPLYLYDLPPVTQTAMDPATVLALARRPNVAGLKSGDLRTCRIVEFSPDRPEDFLVMYSGLDTFDVAWTYGIRRNLDGMFSCTPRAARDMYRKLAAGSIAEARERLDGILALRDAFVSVGVFKGFTVAMNLLGYGGSWSPDYVTPATEEEADFIRDTMRRLEML